MSRPKNVTDKDMLFSKILPALSDNPYSAIHEARQDTLLPDMPDMSNSRPYPLPEDAPDSLALLRSKLFARSNAALPDTFATVNIMEGLVLRHMEQVIEKFNLCRCDRCRCDMAAAALNRLPPKYMVANPTRMTKLENDADSKRVMDALVKAALLVRAHPRH